MFTGGTRRTWWSSRGSPLPSSALPTATLSSMATWNFMVVIIWLVGALVFFGLQYLVIRYGVLHALRQHTMSSTSAVSVVSAVPLRLARVDA